MTSPDSQDRSQVAGSTPSEAFESGGPAAGLSVKPPPSRTLPPSEHYGQDGPRSVASLALERYELDTPVSRRPGARAELFALAARLQAASRSGNEAEECGVAAQLSRALAARGTELDAATRYARRSLLLGEDAELREELAGWFANLGEPLLAAATLRPLLAEKAGLQAAQLSIRVAALQGRGGDVRAAKEALAHAARESPADPSSLEQLGALGAWGAPHVREDEAAQAYLDAAQRREALGERPAAFEDLMRAFELSPGFGPAVERLVAALTARGRLGAADEVRRDQARALPEQARAIHLRRLRDALRDLDLPRAAGAAFDARLDAELDLKSVLAALEVHEPQPGSALGFDQLLLRLGMHQLFAARLELACDSLAGPELARARRALGRLHAGALADTERAAGAWLEALVVEPGAVEARELLKNHALSTLDHAPLVEALVRVGEQSQQGPQAERLSCLHELAALAEERLGAAGLASWAVERILAVAGDDADAATRRERLLPLVLREEEALSAIREQLSLLAGAERFELLGRLVTLLQGRPDRAEEHLAALLELHELAPGDHVRQLAAERLLMRLGRLEALEVFFTRSSERASSDAERSRLALLTAGLLRRRGDLDGALAVLGPLLELANGSSALACMALLLAAERGADGLRARALARVAGGLAPSLRAVLGSVAAEGLLEAGEPELAERTADVACNADPSLARPVVVKARARRRSSSRAAAEALERAMGVSVARASVCGELAELYEKLDEPILAMAWTQRRIALRPGDLAALGERLQRIRRTGDAARIADALSSVLSQPQPLSTLATEIGDCLRQLALIDPTRAAAMARRSLDVLGARIPQLREALLFVADTTAESGLGIAAIERFLSAGSPGAERPELLTELSRRRRAAGDADGAARTLLRAVREGASPLVVLGELERALPTRSSDGELALLEARAEVLGALPEADQAGTARAFRLLGAALYDLAGDTEGALRAFERAMALDPERGPDLFAADAAAFAGSDVAFRRLKALAAGRTDPAAAARLLAIAAGVALSIGKTRDAFEASARALTLDPARTDVLAIAERTAQADEGELLERVYDGLAQASLGRFGERAAEYRAARQFERRREPERALRHAIRAFEAVPSQGVAFAMMARLAEQAGHSTEVVRALSRVAGAQGSSEARAAWLGRAAALAGSSEEGQRQKVDVLLRALSVQGDAELLRSLAGACLSLLAQVPDEREVVELRFSHAVTAMLGKLEGPEGARLGLVAAQVALDAFDSPILALAALQGAFEADADLDEFAALMPRAPDLACAPEASALVARLITLAAEKFGGAGAPLLELGASIAAELGDPRAEAQLLLAAASKAPDDEELSLRAEANASVLSAPSRPSDAGAAPPHESAAPPADVEAIASLERQAEREGDYEALASLLGRRAALCGAADEVRRIRLRRASVLEQRLGRPEDARLELESLITATGDTLSVLRVLADLNERLGSPRRAAPLWLRASAIARDREEAEDLSRRACEAYLAGDDVESARRVLDGVSAWAKSERLLELGVDVERRLNDPQGLADALDALANASSHTPEERAGLLVEAARVLLASGEQAAALAQARRAARVAPASPEPQLLARYLEYVVYGGPGGSEDARIAATELAALGAELSVDQSDLRAFLLAEARDRSLGGDAGLRELVRCRSELGDTPLVSLALAERLAVTEPSQALPLFERALSSDLRGLRALSAVALSAARVAERLGELDRALGYLDPALADPTTREEAVVLSAQLATARSRLRAQPAAPRATPPRSSHAASDPPSQRGGRYSEQPPAARAERLGSARTVLADDESEPSVHGGPPLDEPLESIVPDSPLRPLSAEAALPVPSAPPAHPSSIPPAERSLGSGRPSLSGRYSLSPEDPSIERVGAPVTHVPDPPPLPGRLQSPPPVTPFFPPAPRSPFELRGEKPLTATFAGSETSAEQALYDALRRGSLDAGLELLRMLEHRASRAHDLVSVARRLALLAPGSVVSVARLHDAVLADRDPVYARAVDHVRAVLDSGAVIEPPALAEQPEQPDSVRALLFREQSSRALEALSLVWEGAEHVFRRDPSTYGVTGLERVPPSAATPLSRVYGSVARVLGLLRTPLFQRRSAGPVTVSLALLSPPAVILSGEVRHESAELRFHLGAMLAAATPQFALLFGSPESQGRSVLRGLGFAFGPPRENASQHGAVLNLAEVLWESIPARLQRRLRELCDDPESLTYDAALAAAKLAARRAGLFASGDFGVALRAVAVEESYPLGTPGASPADFVKANPTAANLYALALSAEYAQTRWQFGRGGHR